MKDTTNWKEVARTIAAGALDSTQGKASCCPPGCRGALSERCKRYWERFNYIDEGSDRCIECWLDWGKATHDSAEPM